MGVLNKFINSILINAEDADDYEDYNDFDDFDDEPVNRKKSRKGKTEAVQEEQPLKEVKEKQKATPKITPMRPVKKQGANGMEVCVIKPTSVEDAREITETLLSNRTVVLNVEGLDIDIAQRIIDFTSGSCFAISGNLQKISNYIFIVTPASVDISGDFSEILDSFNSSGLHLDL
ncbi:MAG: cell division protein SepF [Lachnospiraceae bacterium]|nr:cell division protein SepF [Lachnospiraceae bacterium]